MFLLKGRWKYSVGFGSFFVTLVLMLGILLPLFTRQEPVSANSSGNWYSGSWAYRKLLTFTAGSIEGILRNFPVLVNITDADLASYAQSDGDDIFFVNYYDNTTKLSHEIERYTSATGALLCWLNMTTISTSVNKVWMYYGNSVCSSQQNKYGTWNGNFLAVYHMNGANRAAITDSTSNKYNATAEVSDPLYQQNGRIGYAVDLDATDDSIKCPKIFTSETTFSISVFVYPKATTARYAYAQYNETGKGAIIGGDGTSNFYIYIDGTAGGSAMAFGANHWYQITWAQAAGGVSNDYDYLNKTRKSAFSWGNPSWTTTNATWIGNRFDKARDWNGLIDELRIAKVQWNWSWINTTYNSITDSTFTSEGGQMDNVAPVLSSPQPTNSTTGVHIQPRCNITINDADGDSMILTWWSNFSDGTTWVHYQTNSSCVNGTYRWGSPFADYSTKYWWKVYCNDSVHNSTAWYYFTTENEPVSRTWKQLLSGWFRFSNLTSWKQRQTGWFLFRNLTLWEQKLSGYFRFSNQTVFKQDQSGWFNFRNLTGWKQSQSGWFRFGNLTNWKQTQSGWFRFGNQTGFKQVISGFFRFSNQTGYRQGTAGWFRFSNNTVFKQQSSGWFRFSNFSLDTWKPVEQGWFRFGNSTGFKKEASGWFRFSNSTGFKQKVSGWFRFSNLSVGIVILSVYPANHSTNVLRNVTYHVTVADSTGHSMNITWKRDNGTVYLGSSINVYNGTYFIFSNASLANHLYNWSVNITDGVSWLNQSQWYRTGMTVGGAGLVVTGGSGRMNAFLLIGLFGGMMFGLVLWRRKKGKKEK